jgi:hypothetical protein
MFLFYVDESGEIAYNSKSKYFVFNALGISADNWRLINDKVNNLKKSVLRTDEVPILEIKSNWIRFPQERAKHKHLANLSEEDLKRLSNGLMGIIIDNDCTLLSVVVNKDSLLRHYGLNKPEINVFAIQYLLERIALFMGYNHPDKQAIVIMDKCSDSIEKMLNKTHTLQVQQGYSWQNNKNIIENLMFVDSEYNNFIQLTDLCAYNVHRAFKDDNPNYPFFKALLPKFAFSKKDGSINNAGITYKLKEYLKDDNPQMYKFLNTYKNENSVPPNGEYTA